MNNSQNYVLIVFGNKEINKFALHITRKYSASYSDTFTTGCKLCNDAQNRDKIRKRNEVPFEILSHTHKPLATIGSFHSAM